MSDEQKKVVWDVTRACFWLLASIIWAQIVIGFFLTVTCWWAIYTGAFPVGTCKDLQPSIMELLVGGMAVVIAFAGRGGNK
jgi:hypothetical protein